MREERGGGQWRGGMGELGGERGKGAMGIYEERGGGEGKAVNREEDVRGERGEGGHGHEERGGGKLRCVEKRGGVGEGKGKGRVGLYVYIS